MVAAPDCKVKREFYRNVRFINKRNKHIISDPKIPVNAQIKNWLPVGKNANTT